jgi:hypothetical protein
MKKLRLDIDLVSDEFYKLLIDECKKRDVDVNNLKESRYIGNIDIYFEVEE